MDSDIVFRELIEGKDVAIVGPAAYLQGSGFGSKINEYETIVRINRGIELVERYPNDIGRKTDILYSCLIEKAANAGQIDPQVLKQVRGVKMICAPPESDMKGISRRTKLHSMVNHNTVKKIKAEMPLRIVDHDFHTELAKNVNSRPNTGFVAIYDIIRYNPNSLLITGFSFYLDGFMQGCKGGILREKGCTEEQFATLAFNSKRHVQSEMWKYAKSTLLNHDNVVLDDVLRGILEMKEFSREAFRDSSFTI